MDTLLAIHLRAAQIPDSVHKLKFLRSELEESDVLAAPPVRRIPFPTVVAMVIAALAFLFTRATVNPEHAKAGEALSLPAAVSIAPVEGKIEKIWLVEKRPAYWVYSNGLQIRTEYLTESTVRHYVTWSRADLVENAAEAAMPAGIVFHTTESLMLPLEAGEAHSLVRTREAMLDHVPLKPEQVHRMQGELEPQAAAARYESELRNSFRLNGAQSPRFDLLALGMGPEDEGYDPEIFW